MNTPYQQLANMAPSIDEQPKLSSQFQSTSVSDDPGGIGDDPNQTFNTVTSARSPTDSDRSFHTPRSKSTVRRMPTVIRQPTIAFNIFLKCCASFAPIFWVGIYLFSTYTAGDTISSGSISETALRNHSLRVPVVVITGIASVLSGFITICRVIQIRVVYEERSLYIGIWKNLNRIGAMLNIIGHCCLFLMAIFVDGHVHLSFAFIGVAFMLMFSFISAVLTIKERLILYQSFGETFYVDAVLQATLASAALISGIVYITLYLEDCLGISHCDVRPAGNRAEWICFFGMNLVLGSFVITFDHDQQALLEIERWWMWMLWELRGCRDKLCRPRPRDDHVTEYYDVHLLQQKQEISDIQNTNGTMEVNGQHPNDADL